MRVARAFDTIQEALDALQSHTEADRGDASEFLGDVLGRGVLLPVDNLVRNRIKKQTGIELLQLVSRETSPAVLESALNALVNARGDQDLPWHHLTAAMGKVGLLPCLSSALALLAGTGDLQHEALIRGFLDNHDPEVRNGAAEGLEELSFRASAFQKT